MNKLTPEQRQRLFAQFKEQQRYLATYRDALETIIAAGHGLPPALLHDVDGDTLVAMAALASDSQQRCLTLFKNTLEGAEADHALSSTRLREMALEALTSCRDAAIAEPGQHVERLETDYTEDSAGDESHCANGKPPPKQA